MSKQPKEIIVDYGIDSLRGLVIGSEYDPDAETPCPKFVSPHTGDVILEEGNEELLLVLQRRLGDHPDMDQRLITTLELNPNEFHIGQLTVRDHREFFGDLVVRHENQPETLQAFGASSREGFQSGELEVYLESLK